MGEGSHGPEKAGQWDSPGHCTALSPESSLANRLSAPQLKAVLTSLPHPLPTTTREGLLAFRGKESGVLNVSTVPGTPQPNESQC